MKSNLIESTNLSALAPDLNHVEVIFMWDADKNCEIDLSVFLLDDKGNAKTDTNFLYYSNKSGADGLVKILENNKTGASVAITLDDLQKRFTEVKRMAFLLTIHDRKQSLNAVNHIYTQIIDYSDNVLYRHKLAIMNRQVFTTETAMIMCELQLKDDEWHIVQIGEAFDGGLDCALVKYGLI